MNLIQATKTSGQECNRLLDAVVTSLKYMNIIIDSDIYIKLLYDGTVSYLKVFTDYFTNNTNNYAEFTELKKCV